MEMKTEMQKQMDLLQRRSKQTALKGSREQTNKQSVLAEEGGQKCKYLKLPFYLSFTYIHTLLFLFLLLTYFVLLFSLHSMKDTKQKTKPQTIYFSFLSFYVLIILLKRK